MTIEDVYEKNKRGGDKFSIWFGILSAKNKSFHGPGRAKDDQGRLGVLKNGSNWSNFPKALVSISYPGNFRIRP